MENQYLDFERLIDLQQAQPHEHCTDPYKVMDSALSFLQGIVELFIEIRKKLVEKEGNALDFVYSALQQIETTKRQMNDKMQEFQMLESISSITKEYIKCFNLSLYLRFYSRVSEKIFRKFMYYSMNSHSLDFTAKGLLELYDAQLEMCSLETSLKGFHFYSRISKLVLMENQNLIRLLLDMIVDNNYVSSLDEFFRVKLQKSSLSNCIIEEESNDEIQSQIQLKAPNLHTPPLRGKLPFKQQPGTEQQQKRGNKGVRVGKVFRNDFKRQLENILYKYQDSRVRENFLNVLSVDIKKEADKFESDASERRGQLAASPKLPKSRIKQITKRSPNDTTKSTSILRRISTSSSYRPSLLTKDTTTSLHGSQQLESNNRIRSARNDDFFVVTHNIEVSPCNYLRDNPATQNDKQTANMAKPVELDETSNQIKLKPMDGRHSRTRRQSKKLSINPPVRRVPSSVEAQGVKSFVVLDKNKLRIGLENTHTKENLFTNPHRHRSEEFEYNDVLQCLMKTKPDLNSEDPTKKTVSSRISTEQNLEDAINRLLVRCGLFKTKINLLSRTEKVRKPTVKIITKPTEGDSWRSVLGIDMLTTNHSKQNISSDDEYSHFAKFRKKSCGKIHTMPSNRCRPNLISDHEQDRRKRTFRSRRRRQFQSLSSVNRLEGESARFAPTATEQHSHAKLPKRDLYSQQHFYRQLYQTNLRQLITPVIR